MFLSFEAPQPKRVLTLPFISGFNLYIYPNLIQSLYLYFSESGTITFWPEKALSIDTVYSQEYWVFNPANTWGNKEPRKAVTTDEKRTAVVFCSYSTAVISVSAEPNNSNATHSISVVPAASSQWDSWIWSSLKLSLQGDHPPGLQAILQTQRHLKALHHCWSTVGFF